MTNSQPTEHLCPTPSVWRPTVNLTCIPNLTDNRDGSWTYTGGLHGTAWTIRDCGGPLLEAGA